MKLSSMVLKSYTLRNLVLVQVAVGLVFPDSYLPVPDAMLP